MSLLEDIFLGDEANEAQELERVIDGDEYDDRPRSEIRSPSNSDDNSEKEDEAEEEKRRVDPTNQKAKRVVKNPRFILNPARLIGPRGIQVIPEQFKDFKFKGKGHEKEDLDIVLKKLEHWAYRLYPKYQFEDCLKKIETLGKKQPVKVHLHRIRTDQLLSHETVVQKDSSDDEKPDTPQEEDEFDKLLQQQIELARATPAPGSVKKGFMTPAEKTFAAPRATSSPSINDEQRERMIRNRQLAEERRLAKIKANNSANVTIDLSESQQQENTRIVEDNEVIDITEPGLSKTATHIEKSTTVDLTEQYSVETISRHTISNAEDIIVLDNEVVKPRIVKRSNVIDSSDDECDVIAVNQSVSVDIHADFGASNNTQNLDIINKADIVSDNSNINTDITDDGGMEICTEPIDTVQDNMGANVKDLSSGDSISNTNVDIIRTENADMSNKNNEDIRTEYSGNNSDIDSTEFSGSTNTKDISAANKENFANSNDVNIVNTEDNIVNNQVKSNAQLEDIEVSENDILTVTNKDIEIKNSDDSILKHNDDTFEKDKAEENLITCENGKAKNIDPEINKENVDKNIVPNQNINEELMDVDFSEEF